MKFFVAFVATLACAFASPSAYGAYGPAPYYGGYYGGYSSYAHAPAPVTVLPNGFLADTPEVAHAKAAHLAEKAKVASYAAPAYAHGSYGYPAYGSAYAGAYAYGPAHITVLPNGYLADTPEVSHAKAAHAVAKSHVAAAAAASPDYDSYSHGYAAPYAYAPYVAAPAYGYAAPYSGYSGYYGKPVVTPSGFLADTPEVAHAKAAHLAVKAAAAHSYHHY